MLFQNTFEQWQRVSRLARCRVHRRQVITSVLFARAQLNRTLQEATSFV